MTDEVPTPEPGSPEPGTPQAESPGLPDPSDARDPRIASMLEVPRLDETTRRRIVRTAVSGAAGARGAEGRGAGRWGAAIGVAAALLVGTVVGAAVVTRPNEPDTPSAARASSTAPTTAAAEAVVPAPQSAEDEVGAADDASAAPAQVLGDLGAVRGATELRSAIQAAFEQGGAERGGPGAALPCSEQPAGLLGFVVTSAIGEAQLDGLPVVVVVGPAPTGEDLAVVLDPARGCQVVERLTL